MDKLKLMVDMDDVLYENAFQRIIEEYLGRKITKEEVDRNGYYLQNLVENKADFFNYFFQKNMYDYANIVKNSQEVLKELVGMYDVYILTAYTFVERRNSCGDILKHKYDRLINDYPFLDPHNFCFVNDKSVVKSDIMIDDRLRNLTGANLKLLFSSFHNQNYPDYYLEAKGVKKVNDWEEIGKILIKK